MISNLFKPAWEHKNPERRVEAILAMTETDPEQQQILQRLAELDPVDEVQAAAIGKVTNLAVLVKLASQAESEEARTRIHGLIRSAIPGHQEALAQFLDSASSEFLLEVCCHCPAADIRISTLTKYDDQQLLAAIAAESEFSDTREMAANRVERLELLEPLWKKIRDRDKNLAKSLHDRIDLLHEVEAHKKQLSEQAEKIISGMQELQASVWTPQYNLRFYSLVNQWQQFESELDENLLNKYREFAIGVESVVIAHRLVLETLENQAQLAKDAESLLVETQQMSAAKLQSLMERWTILRRVWLDSQAIVSAEQDVAQKFDQSAVFFDAVERLLTQQQAFIGETTAPAELVSVPAADGQSASDLLDINCADSPSPMAGSGLVDLKRKLESMEQAIREIRWPDHLPIPNLLSEFEAKIEAQQAAIKSLLEHESAQVDSVTKQIVRLNSAVRRGDLRMARGVYKKITAKFDRLNSQQQKKLSEHWAKADKAFTEMIDWKEFAIQPKFIELCEKMEVLAEATDSPLERAESIKSLQQEWKKLDALAADEVWQRFKVAGDRAYEPCAAHYLEAEKTRAANLEQRKLVVQKLAQLAELPEQEEWSATADWKSLQSEFRKVRDEWRKYADVDSQKSRKVGKRYGELTRKLDAHLQQQFAANAARKQQLIDRAMLMQKMDSAGRSLDKLKELQSNWKTVGITDRKEDQKLWKAFQEACDGVFALYKQGVDEIRAVEKNQTDEAKKIIEAVKSLAKPTVGMAPDEAKLNELQQAFSLLPKLGDSLQKNLERELQKASEAVHRAITKFKTDKSKGCLQEMRRRAELCAAIEQLDVEKNANKMAKLLEDWDLVELPANANQLMEQRKTIALAQPREIGDLAEIARGRRLICIQLENLLGRESPESDRKLRMEYQMQVLKSQGLGSKTSIDSKALIEELQLRWYSMPATDATQQLELNERFEKLTGQ